MIMTTPVSVEPKKISDVPSLARYGVSMSESERQIIVSQLAAESRKRSEANCAYLPQRAGDTEASRDCDE